VWVWVFSYINIFFFEIAINGQQTAPVAYAAGPCGVCVTYEKCNQWNVNAFLIEVLGQPSKELKNWKNPRDRSEEPPQSASQKHCHLPRFNHIFFVCSHNYHLNFQAMLFFSFFLFSGWVNISIIFGTLTRLSPA